MTLEEMTAARDAVLGRLANTNTRDTDGIDDVTALPFEPGEDPAIALTRHGEDFVVVLQVV